MTWFDADMLHWPVTVVYLALLCLIAIYGLHRWWLIALYALTHKRVPQPRSHFRELPPVTVQLPMFNERAVAERIIDAACQLDWPHDRLQVQVLDDSTDAQAIEVTLRRVEHWRRRGIDIEYVHRTDRRGYKAGALADAAPKVTGDFIAIFDADFIPPADFLRRTIDHFTDPGVGLVQARWAHVNRNQSLLTRCEAAFIDGHFAIEQAARQRSGRWFHFNGTAGVWRKTAIEQAGGWSADTLCEDLDLSIRAQLAGWRFVYLNDVECPAELPPTVAAFKQQQHRWFKGTTQVLRKLWAPAMLSDAPLKVKLELTMQLIGPILPLLLTAMALLYLPANMIVGDGRLNAWWTAIAMLGGLTAATAFYAASQYVLRRSIIGLLLLIPVMIAVGMAIALTNTRGVIEAMLGRESAFLRTPKFNDGQRSDDDPLASVRRGFNVTRCVTLLETFGGFYMLACVGVALYSPTTRGFTPLLVLFAWGYLWFASSGLRTVGRCPTVTAPASSEPVTA